MSNIIVDISNTGQSGLSMRVLEVLALGKKLLTTNVNIKKLAIYTDKQIQILDESCQIDADFLSRSGIFPISDEIKQLHIDVWLEKILANGE
jgi:hypothetical protein